MSDENAFKLFEEHNIPRSAWEKLFNGELVPIRGSILDLINDFKDKYFINISPDQIKLLLKNQE